MHIIARSIRATSIRWQSAWFLPAAVLPLLLITAAHGQTANEFYSAAARYRVAFPPGTEVHRLDEVNGAAFRIAAGNAGSGAMLQGSVASLVDAAAGQRASSSASSATIAQRCENSIRELRTAVITYKVIKSDWYVFSGTLGTEIVYEKGIVVAGTSSAVRLRLTYPASAKQVFNPMVGPIANSFGEYVVVTAKAGVMTGEDGQAGLLFLTDVPGDTFQLFTVCAVDAKDRPLFDKVEEDQTITVGGYPQIVNVRAQTDQSPSVDHRRLMHCALRPSR